MKDEYITLCPAELPQWLWFSSFFMLALKIEILEFLFLLIKKKELTLFISEKY